MSTAVKTNRIGKFDLNPRGNLWMKDENKFGLKLLTKMGWSQGKGLGKNENGIAENIKIRMKKGNSGVGWTEKAPVGIENDEYDAIFRNLSKNLNTFVELNRDNNSPSLENRSQQFKKRMHYQKFMKGKDVCRYSEKDMNSIFILKKPKNEPDSAISEPIINTEVCLKDEKTQGLTPIYKSQFSIKDYFEMKIKQKLGGMKTTHCAEIYPSIEELCSVKKEISSKKRKKEPRNKEISKRIKIESETSDEMEVDTKHICEQSVIEIPISSKKRKKQKSKTSEKQKLNKFQTLQSCLKSKSKYSFKQKLKTVSFNEHVSYKIIVSDVEETDSEIVGDGNTDHNVPRSGESVECLNGESTQKQIYNITYAENAIYQLHEGQNSSSNPSSNVSKNKTMEKSGNIGEAISNVTQSSALPRTGDSDFNFWIESQRQAMKMKSYKNMFKKMEKHSILRTSNLSEIKGYGNWGL